MLALFERELIDLLRTAPRCTIPFSKFVFFVVLIFCFSYLKLNGIIEMVFLFPDLYQLFTIISAVNVVLQIMDLPSCLIFWQPLVTLLWLVILHIL